MRWYQQSVQGMNPATSEKYRLPSVMVAATIHASHSAYGAIASSSSAATRTRR
jgi:hypothetical protein